MDNLTPDELALKMEGEALLKKITGSQSPIVGPDGSPAPGTTASPEEAAKAAKVLSEEEAKAAARKSIDAHVAKLKAANAKERDESLAKMKAVCDENKVARQCVQAMLHAHRIIAWAKLELQTLDERVDDKALMHVERQVHGAVYAGGGFNSQALSAEIRKRVCELIDERNRYYSDCMRKRKVQIHKTIKRMGTKGFSMPCKSLELERDKKMLGTFGPGGLVVLYGAQKAIDASMKIFGLLHANEDNGKVHHYTCSEVVPPSYCEEVTMVVASWWRNALSSICKFYDTLRPVVDSPSTMLLVDDLNALLLAPDTQMAVAERKGRVLTALRQWAVENAVVVIVGDPRDLELARSANYGGLVCAPVRFEKKNDAVRLLIGEDEIDVGDLKLEAE